MNVLAMKDGRSYAALALDALDEFIAPFSGTLFPCLIWDHDGRATEEQRHALALALLEAGCRYFVCGGENCAAWHDDVDTEFVQQHLDEPDDVRDAAHVMTTWHEDESVDDVAFYFVSRSNLHEHEFTRFLVLHVGHGPTRAELDAAVRRHALEDP
jgi:hypothetical protein